MIDIALQGICGRMGRVLMEMIAEREDCRVTAGVDAQPGEGLPCPVFPGIQGLSTLPEMPDALIDFSHPTGALTALEFCAKNALPCVICTTGLDEEARGQLQKAAQKTPVFFSANMSIGINLMARLARKAQEVLKGFDIEIVERHHRNKLDAPSGTALMLADAINQQAEGRYHYVYDRQPVRQKRNNDEIGISAVRGGSIVGEHDVLFCGPDEVITLSHTAYSRTVFATGAVAAALFVAGKAPGLYSMDDMLEGL